jgi:hypothetical protein
MLPGVVDGVTRHLHNQIFVCDARLAAQTAFRLQPPRFIQHVVFIFGAFRQRIETFTHDAVAGGAGARFFTGVFDFNAVAQRNVKNGFTALRFQYCAIRAKILMRQKNNLRHY